MTWYESAQVELAAEEEKQRQLDNVDSYGMTVDERNWATVLIHEKPKPRTSEARYLTLECLRSLAHNPERALEYYIETRKKFTRKISHDRRALEQAGKSEPVSVTILSNDGDVMLRNDIDSYESALCVLYHFKPYDFLYTPTLGDLRRIDLKKIAEDPSAGYLQFMLDFIGSI